jgi:hypothetical protein
VLRTTETFYGVAIFKDLMCLNERVLRGKSGWKNSCRGSTMGERQPINTGVRGVLAGRLAGHKMSTEIPISAYG